MADDFVVRGSVAELDPELHRLLQLEEARQHKTIILIPSESTACDAVNEALGAAFGNVYAEGYPREESRRQTEAEILDVEMEVATYRRFSDPRYYKGVEYADVLEALTRRRAAELFAANGVSPDDIYVNVQALSGAPANNAVYSALLEPGDTIMGLNLNDGGHLSHGAPVNRTGRIYNGVPYFVDPHTEMLDYEAIEAQALAVKPQIIVAGFSAYPLVVDWQRFRAIADRVGAYLLADIAHISGLVAAGVHPSPIGIADVVTTTTHKSLTGPRGAMIMTHRADAGPQNRPGTLPGRAGRPPSEHDRRAGRGSEAQQLGALPHPAAAHRRQRRPPGTAAAGTGRPRRGREVGEPPAAAGREEHWRRRRLPFGRHGGAHSGRGRHRHQPQHHPRRRQRLLRRPAYASARSGSASSATASGKSTCWPRPWPPH